MWHREQEQLKLNSQAASNKNRTFLEQVLQKASVELA